MSAHQIGVGALGHEQCIDGFLTVAQPGGTHGHHRIVPSPGLVPVPSVPNPVERFLHDGFVEESGVGQDAIGAQHGGMVADILDVRIGVGGIGGSQIQPVLMCQRVHLHGSAGHFQRPLPVGQFERRVDGGLGRERFLCRDAAAQGIGGGSLTGGLAGKVEHELGGLFNQRTETPDVRTRATQQFGEIDEMRLLPNEVAACFRRGFLGAGVGHLHPTDALVALSLGNLAGHRLGLEIPVERPLKQFGMSPKRELCLMPPNHLQVIFAEP